jgi:hypothetical protein
VGARDSCAGVALSEWQNVASANENHARGAQAFSIAPAT